MDTKTVAPYSKLLGTANCTINVPGKEASDDIDNRFLIIGIFLMSLLTIYAILYVVYVSLKPADDYSASATSEKKKIFTFSTSNHSSFSETDA